MTPSADGGAANTTTTPEASTREAETVVGTQTETGTAANRVGGINNEKKRKRRRDFTTKLVNMSSEKKRKTAVVRKKTIIGKSVGGVKAVISAKTTRAPAATGNAIARLGKSTKKAARRRKITNVKQIQKRAAKTASKRITSERSMALKLRDRSWTMPPR